MEMKKGNKAEIYTIADFEITSRASVQLNLLWLLAGLIVGIIIGVIV